MIFNKAKRVVMAKWKSLAAPKVEAAKQALRRRWLAYRLAQLEDEQICINQVVRDYEVEMEQLRRFHAVKTLELSRKRTTIRTQMVRR